MTSAEVMRLAVELSTCLDEEKAALAAGRSEAISDTTIRKNALIDALQRASQAIRLDSLAPGAQRELAELMQRCKQQNLANAALLDARINQVRWALNQLGLGGPATYGRDGRTQNQFAARSVGSA
jgi:flagellar biosynthesis/type III secretory pathway chaperone